MIEIHNNTGTQSYGCCRNMKEAQGILTYLKDTGQIPASEKNVTVCHYKNGGLVCVSQVEYREGKWRPIKPATPRKIPAEVMLAAA